MAAAASTPHHYCFDSYSSEMLNMQVPFLNYDHINSIPLLHYSNSEQLVPQMETHFNHVLELGEAADCTGSFLPPYAYSINYNTPMPAPDQDLYWAIQEKAGTKGEETDQVKVGRYSVEERKDRILRYLKKRNQRNFNKTIKYACRKTLADKRVRVRGRFAKNNEAHHDSCYQQINSTEMMKYEEDYWLEAAIDNLRHLSY